MPTTFKFEGIMGRLIVPPCNDSACRECDPARDYLRGIAEKRQRQQRRSRVALGKERPR